MPIRNGSTCALDKLYSIFQSCPTRSLRATFGPRSYFAEVESRTQGSRPRPRPRTQKKSEAKAKAKDSPSEDRTSRGQGQECSRPRPRTKDTGASVLQKKSLQKFFSGDLQFVGVPRIYWDKPKPQIE